MPTWTRKPVLSGDRVTVEIQHSTRYSVHGRRLPPVALLEVSIFTDPTTGALWAEAYELPPRQHSPYPPPQRYPVVAEPDDRGGIARMRSCWWGAGCVCPTLR